MNYKLPYNWDEHIARLVAKEEGGQLLLSPDHYPVITKDIWVDAVTERKRASKWIIYSELAEQEKVYDRLDSLYNDFFMDSEEYQLAFLAFGNGARIVEIRPLWSLCYLEGCNDE